ncbi:MAG: FtsW/RodA/SpoVE family cell cycle protein, partial [Desulfotomaculales bacterium]
MRKNPPDFLLLLSVIILVGLGVIMVFSASEYSTLVRYNDSFYFFKRQLLWAAMGFAAMFVALNYDYRRLRRWAGLALILAFVLLVAVFVPGVGRSSHGA